MTDAELQRRTGEPHIDGWPLYSGLPPPQAVHTAAAELADHVPADTEAEAATDAKLGLVMLPPIRVDRATHAALQQAAKARGVILPAIVRERLAPYTIPTAAHTAAAELARPMTERDQFDMAMWHARLGELADAYYEAGRTNPARQRARADLMLHALECATGWRTRSALAAHTAAAPQAQAVRALTDPELDAVFVHTIECAQLSRDEFKAIAFAVLAAAQQGE